MMPPFFAGAPGFGSAAPVSSVPQSYPASPSVAPPGLGVGGAITPEIAEMLRKRLLATDPNSRAALLRAELLSQPGIREALMQLQRPTNTAVVDTAPPPEAAPPGQGVAPPGQGGALPAQASRGKGKKKGHAKRSANPTPIGPPAPGPVPIGPPAPGPVPIDGDAPAPFSPSKTGPVPISSGGGIIGGSGTTASRPAATLTPMDSGIPPTSYQASRRRRLGM